MKSKFILLLLCLCFICGFCTIQDEKISSSESLALTASHAEAEQWAAATLTELSLEQKVGQMICEQMRGDIEIGSPEFQDLLQIIQDHEVGAFVLYGGSSLKTAALLNRLQQETKIPLFISSDFEGGPGQQIKDATEFPANMALSAIGSESVAYQLGKAGAIEGRAIGIHITYSPVVDIQTQPNNPVLSVRSFGRDLELLGTMAGAYIRGYQENGMLATAKHYPGRGDVEFIPGTEFTINNKPADRVESEDFYAFKLAIDAGVTYVMSEHIAIPSVTDGSDLPASVEKKLGSYWLREKLGFTGILTTDDMWYEKVTKRFGPVNACIMAIQAGHDAVLKPADVGAVIEGLVAAVQSGDIPEEQINRSVEKILYWKARLNLHQNKFVDMEKIPSVVKNPEHVALMNTIADTSLTLVQNEGYFPCDVAKFGKIAHISVQKKANDPNTQIVASKLEAAFPDLTSYFFGPESGDELYAEVKKAAMAADTVFVSLFYQRNTYIDNGPLPDKDQKLLEQIVKQKPGAVIFMSYGNPYHAARFSQAAAIVVGYGEGSFYGNQTVYADSFIRLLKGEIVPQGKLPVDVSEQYPMGTGITY